MDKWLFQKLTFQNWFEKIHKLCLDQSEWKPEHVIQLTEFPVFLRIPDLFSTKYQN